jgi:hypothetical protein
MLLVLSAPRSMVNLMFVLCAGTGPTLGVFYGGWMIDRVGGYIGTKQRLKCLKICFTTGICAGIIATVAALAENFYFFICCLWLILFFGASLLPACTGMLISVVPRQYRPISSSLSIFIFNIFGYSFSLFLSGYLMQVRISLSVSLCLSVSVSVSLSLSLSLSHTHSLSPRTCSLGCQIVGFYFPECDLVCSRRTGYRVVLLWSYWSLVFLFLALFSAIQDEKRRESKSLSSSSSALML